MFRDEEIERANEDRVWFLSCGLTIIDAFI